MLAALVALLLPALARAAPVVDEVSVSRVEQDVHATPGDPDPARRKLLREVCTLAFHVREAHIATRLAVLARHMAVTFTREGRHEQAILAHQCAIEAVDHRGLDIPGKPSALGPAHLAGAAAIERLASRWWTEYRAEKLSLRRIVGHEARLLAEHVYRGPDLACLRAVLRTRRSAPCYESLRLRVAHVAGAYKISIAGSTTDAILTAARPPIGLVPSEAAAAALATVATEIDRREGAGIPFAVTARWLRGLALLERGEDGEANRWLPDADMRAYGKDAWFGQLLTLRSRILRDRGRPGDALVASTHAIAATDALPARLEHAANLRAAGRLREAGLLLEPKKNEASCSPIELHELPAAERDAWVKHWTVTWPTTQALLRDELAGFAADLGYCRPTRPDRALATVREALRVCVDCEMTSNLLDLQRVLIADAAALRRGTDLETCDRSLRALDEVYPKDHPVAAEYNDRGITYYAQGRLAAARDILDVAACFSLSRNPDQELRILANAAGVRMTMGDLAGAEQRIARALTLASHTRATSRETAPLRANLGKVVLARGHLDEARRHFAAALDSVGTEDSALRADLLDSVGLGEDLAGHHDAAERDYRDALALRESLAPDHPAIMTSLSHLATLAWARGQPHAALPLFDRMLRLEEESLVRLLVWGTEADKRDAIARLSDRLDWLVTYDLEVLRDHPDATRLAFQAVISRQGRALDAAAKSQAALFTAAPDAARALFAEQQRVHERIVWLTLRAPLATDDDRRRRAEELQQLRTHATILGQQIHDELGALDRTAVAGLERGIDTLAARLRSGQALLNYVVFRPFHPAHATRRFDEPHYAAYVLTPDGRLRHIDLGPAAAIDAEIQRWRTALASRSARALPLAAALHHRLFAPVASLLGDARDVYVVPDAALNLIPFEALRSLDDRHLLERWRFTTLTSARDLATAPVPARPTGDIVVYADIDFGDPAAAAHAPGRDSSLLGRTDFEPLPATAAEAAGIRRAFAGAKLLRGSHASGASLRGLRRPAILHVASHGFFLGGERAALPHTRGMQLAAASGAALLPPPTSELSALLRSGIVLAGANIGDPDAVVAGLDLAGLDLVGTRLVTLSACESGIGDTASGDGVHGIRRALHLAGSESQVLSLWRVNDEATSMLMIRFYDLLARGTSRGEALRVAKIAVASTPRFAHPYFWAAFILGGSQDTLDGASPGPVAELRLPDASRQPATRNPPGCTCRGSGDPMHPTLILALVGLLWRRRRASVRPPARHAPTSADSVGGRRSADGRLCAARHASALTPLFGLTPGGRILALPVVASTVSGRTASCMRRTSGPPADARPIFATGLGVSPNAYISLLAGIALSKVNLPPGTDKDDELPVQSSLTRSCSSSWSRRARSARSATATTAPASPAGTRPARPGRTARPRGPTPGRRDSCRPARFPRPPVTVCALRV